MKKQNKPSDTKSMKDEIVRQTCDQYGVEYSHYDWFKQPYGHGGEDLNNAVCIIYPGPGKPWVLAINFDGSVVRPGDSILKKATQLVISVITKFDI